jgi:hypothetical protein
MPIAACSNPPVRGHGALLVLVTNARGCVTPQDWERLRRMITRRAGYRCEICGAAEDRGRWLEAHERWAYHDPNGVPALRRLICLCSDCHLTTHLGYANVTGRSERALAHLRQVTGMTDEQVRRHVRAANDLWTARSRHIWSRDLRILTTTRSPSAAPNTPPTGPPSDHAADGPTIAERALNNVR